MGFRTLRVMNEDTVRGGSGFGSHPHRDMEIVTNVLSGALEHKDSMGHGAVLRPGEMQRITAGTGMLHSEFNPSQTEPVHLYQVWITPRERGLKPGYEQKAFDPRREAESPPTRRLAGRGRRVADDPAGRPALSRRPGRGPRGWHTLSARAAASGSR